MVSDMELIERLQEFLRNSDLNTTTTGIVRRQLEEDFGVDLSDRKVFIREQVDLFLQSQFENAQDDCENEEEHDDDEDGKTAKVKSEGSGASDGEEAEDDDEASNRKGPAKRRSSSNRTQLSMIAVENIAAGWPLLRRYCSFKNKQ